MIYVLLQCPPRLCLGPFIMYTTPVSALISSCSLNHHLYTDDTQLFISFRLTDVYSSIDHDSVNMAWNPAAVCIDSDRFGHGSGQATVHGVTSHCSLLVVLLSVVATACGTAITHDRRSTIPLSGFIHCHLDSQGPDETTTGCSECCS